MTDQHEGELIRTIQWERGIKFEERVTASHAHARTLLGVNVLTEQKRLFVLSIKKGLSVRELENLVQSKTKGGSRRIKYQTTRDHEIIALEEDLQKTLGTKVRVVPQKKRGKIVVEYYSLDDLDRIIRLIKK